MQLILSPTVTRPVVSTLKLTCIVFCTAAAAWISQSTLASTGASDVRIAFLPLTLLSFGACGLAALGVLAASRAGASLAPLWLLVLVVLPWLPGGAPAVFGLWSGPLALLLWMAVALAMCASASGITSSLSSFARRLVNSRPQVAAGVFAGLIYAIAAWQVAPSVPGGDEPHYLIITQSLLRDGDLKIENNHRAGDYHAYYAGDLSKPDFRRKGRNGEIYSIHAPGLPALIAPAFALGGYHGVMVFLVLLAAAGSALAWHLAWLVTRRADAAWFGWAAVTFSTSAIFHSFTVYPDGPGGVIVLTGVWALLRADHDSRSGDERTLPWLLHGAALATLPWIHTRFALLAGGLGAVILLRLGTNRNPAAKAVAFLSLPAVSALCWVGYFVNIYGTPDPSAPYANEEGAASFIPGGLAGLIFDQRFGLLAYAPVLFCAFAGLVAMVMQRARRRLGLELLFVLIPYLLAVTHFAMWWGGTSAPARFFVPMLPMLAIPAAVAWTGIRHRATRVMAIASLAATAWASAVLVFVDDGQLAFNVRQGLALWLEWLSVATDLPRGLPAWWRGSEPALYRDITIWGIAIVAAWGVLRSLERARALRTRGAFAAAAGAVYAVAAMAAITIVWTVNGVQGRIDAPAQLHLVRRLGTERHALLLQLPALRRLDVGAVLSQIRIEPAPSTTLGGAGPNDRPLYQIPSVPAGSYRVTPHGPNLGGWLMVGIGRDQFSLQSGPLAGSPDPIILDFPVNVRAIVVRGDEQARRSIHDITLEPLSVVVPGAQLTGRPALRAVKYGGATAFFLDDRSFPEPEGFWVGGARTSDVVLQPDWPAAQVRLLMHNGPTPNQASLRSGKWHLDVPLDPGEERTIAVPLDAVRGALALNIRVASGFRPAALDARSRDTRFLGVWLKILD
jgi:hypothetical protein